LQHETTERVKPILVDQLRDYYNALPGAKKDKVALHELSDMAHLCGQDLENEEIVYLARICNSGGGGFNFERFLAAVEMYIQTVREDRYKLIRDVLKSMVGRHDGKTGITELMDSIKRCNILSDEDLVAIYDELRYLPFEKDLEIRIEVVARFVRDMTEGLPF